MRERLADRKNWQEEAGERGLTAEKAFAEIMDEHLQGTRLKGESKPKDLKGIYGIHPDPRGRMRPYGVEPDYVVRSLVSNRLVFVEVKRQDPAGNAHERACKYMMPGMLDAMREVGNQPPEVIPMWWIFTNGLAGAARYEREIMFWFRGIEQHVLLWGDRPSEVTAHFDQFIRPMLE